MNKPFLADEPEQQSLQHLSRLARSLADGLASAAAPLSGDAAGGLAAKVRTYLRARRRRDELLGSDVFADPVWDVLLDLFASAVEGLTGGALMSSCRRRLPPPWSSGWSVFSRSFTAASRRQGERATERSGKPMRARGRAVRVRRSERPKRAAVAAIMKLSVGPTASRSRGGEVTAAAQFGRPGHAFGTKAGPPIRM
jgi:hypothetical protein